MNRICQKSYQIKCRYIIKFFIVFLTIDFNVLVYTIYLLGIINNYYILLSPLLITNK